MVDTNDEVPDIVAARDHVVTTLVTFCRSLRRAGVAVPANASITATRALVTVGFDEEERAHAALQASLVSRSEDIPTFERLFPAFWRRLTRGLVPNYDDSGVDYPTPDGQFSLLSTDTDSTDSTDSTDTDAPETNAQSMGDGTQTRTVGNGATEETEHVTTARYSPTGRSEPVSVDSPPSQEQALDRALRRLTRALAGERGRRWEQSGIRQVDARRALRESVSTGGTVVSLPERDRHEQSVRAVMLVDVSRSVLDVIDRGFLVRFLRAVTGAWRSVRVFFFDTSLRDVTEPFHTPTDEAALAALRQSETEWGGGTRIGNAVWTIKREYATVVDRRTVVFLVSDGLETGEVDRLEAGMVWLSRRAERVLWLNPLCVSPSYEPTARGMAAALPYVDGLFAFSGPDDLGEIARQLELDRQSIGYEYDPRRTTDHGPG